ncbi:hypothetical protein [Flammeovirga sp. SubArs3]|uniref:hypothetical protein n=1 Tax=Flammeovirga sp. SubArs3 TaxID=2995316 RepID=UPI00248B35CE|nr:hypothetical protein [Flammeovirga sp. SubArs3]
MKKLLALLPISLLIFSCNKDVEPIGGNFDKVLESPGGDTLMIYHSGGFFEGYIISSKEYLKSGWNYNTETNEGTYVDVSKGMRWIDCKPMLGSFDNFPTYNIEELKVSSKDFVSCDF